MKNKFNIPSGADDEKKAILNAHEEVIVRSIKSNLEAARALAAIYQGSLWRFADTSYEGFNVYCEHRNIRHWKNPNGGEKSRKRSQRCCKKRRGLEYSWKF